jgi:hypothetical protein
MREQKIRVWNLAKDEETKFYVNPLKTNGMKVFHYICTNYSLPLDSRPPSR